MCRLLIWNKPSRDESHQRGDVIAVVGNNHLFSKSEDKTVWVAQGNPPADWNGHTWIIDIPEMTKRRADRLIARHKVPASIIDPEFAYSDPEDRFITKLRRKFRFSLSGAKLDKIRATGRVSLTKPQARTFLSNLSGDGEEYDFGND